MLRCAHKFTWNLASSAPRIIILGARHYSRRNLVKTLDERKMLAEIFPRESVHSLIRLLERPKPSTVYAGFDPTAPSLHVGNLLVLMSLLHFQRAGHRVVVLLGGATARIGDPSGRNSEREALDEKVIDNNIEGIKRDIQNILRNHNENFWTEERGNLHDVEVVDNDVEDVFEAVGLKLIVL